MIPCARFPCGGHTGGCSFADCINNRAPGMNPPGWGSIPQPFTLPSTPSPRYLPVNIPFSLFGITIVTLDDKGNVTIKVDQPYPPVASDHHRSAASSVSSNQRAPERE